MIGDIMKLVEPTNAAPSTVTSAFDIGRSRGFAPVDVVVNFRYLREAETGTTSS